MCRKEAATKIALHWFLVQMADGETGQRYACVFLRAGNENGIHNEWHERVLGDECQCANIHLMMTHFLLVSPVGPGIGYMYSLLVCIIKRNACSTMMASAGQRFRLSTNRECRVHYTWSRSISNSTRYFSLSGFLLLFAHTQCVCVWAPMMPIAQAHIAVDGRRFRCVVVRV